MTKYIRRALALAAGTVMALGNTMTLPEANAALGACDPPPYGSAGYYDFVQSYNAQCSTTKNWDRQFTDARIVAAVDDRNRLSVLTSTALGGAIASLKFNNKEFIASGGHGSAFQYAFHAWQSDEASSECYNPTQAGARVDDVGKREPFHGPSTSALYTMARSAASIRTESRPAMYITRADPLPGWNGCLGAERQPDRAPYTYGLSPYWLQTLVQLSPGHTAGLTNVVRLTASLTSEDTAHEVFDGVHIAYLQRDFTSVYSYDPVRNRVARDGDGTLASRNPLLRCTADDRYCFGMYVRPAVLGGSAYYYAQTRAPSEYNGMAGEYTLQVTSPALNVQSGRVLRYETYVSIGDRHRVTASIRALHQQLGAPQGPGKVVADGR